MLGFTVLLLQLMKGNGGPSPTCQNGGTSAACQNIVSTSMLQRNSKTYNMQTSLANKTSFVNTQFPMECSRSDPISRAKCVQCPSGSTGQTPYSGCTCLSGIGAITPSDGEAGYAGGCSTPAIQEALSTSLSEVQAIRPTAIADLNKKEGLLYDIMSKIADMCTVTEEDIASGTAVAKNQMCSNVPILVIGNYEGGKVSDSSEDHFEDMEDTGCADLPLAAAETFFIFGISLPEILPLSFEGGNLCFAQLLDGNSPKVGTGLIIFAPKLFVGNPIVGNLNVPVPGLGKAITAASALIEYVAVGVSFQDNPAIEVEFSGDFWRCQGECKTVKANIYAAIKLDLTEYSSKKLSRFKSKKLQLGDLSVAFEAKCLIDFDPSRNGFMSQVDKIPLLSNMINGNFETGESGLQSLIDPNEALDFLMEVMQNDFAIGIDGKLTITIPLGDWTHGLFRDLDVTVGAASALFRKTEHCTTSRRLSVTNAGRRRFWGRWRSTWVDHETCTPEMGLFATLALGGLANSNIMDDIKQKVLDKFNSPPVRAVIGLLGDGISDAVNLLTSVGVQFDLYAIGNCAFADLDAMCSGYAFGLRFHALAFEAFMERATDGEFAFCFAIKELYDSCGNGFENVLVLLKQLGEVIVKVAQEIATAVVKTFNAVTKEVAQLAEQALEQGKVVIDSIGEGFESGAADVAIWSAQAGGDVVEFAGDAVETVGNAVNEGVHAATGAIVNGMFVLHSAGSDALDAASSAADVAMEWSEGAVNTVGDTAVQAVNTVADGVEAGANAVADGVEAGANAVAGGVEDGANAVAGGVEAGASEVASQWRRRRRSSNLGHKVLGAFRS